MNVVIGIQARTNSSRLPGKVLLPVGGLPISVLAAKRAGNNGLFKVTVLTSDELSDDQLCHTLTQYNVATFRGSLNNVLQRFVDAFSTENDNTVVVRLTADNVVPDASFIQELIDYFILNKCDYLCANGDESGLPYGFSAEVTYLKHLREASILATTDFEKEHVTPFIRNQFGSNYYKKYYSHKLGRLRCTVDNLDDYLLISKIFNYIDDPINFSSWEVIEQLKSRDVYAHCNIDKMALGCVQLGLDYGIKNSIGKPKPELAYEMLSYVARSGIEYLDTANAYGNSEKVIGDWLKQGWNGRIKIITKLDPAPIELLPENTGHDYIQSHVHKAFMESCCNLQCDVLDVYMLHLATQLKSHSGFVYKSLLDLKTQGKIRRLGVSVQTPDELALALSYPDISVIQLPFNLFDDRWLTCVPDIMLAKSRRKLEVHVRSVFLQGLMLTDNLDIWSKALETSPLSIINWLKDMVCKYKCSSVAEFAILYVRSQPWIDKLVLGSENLQQVENNIASMKETSLSFDDFKFIEQSKPNIASNKMINPSKWS